MDGEDAEVHSTLPDGVRSEVVRRPPTDRYLPPEDGDTVEIHCVLLLVETGQEVHSTRGGPKPYLHTIGAQGDVASPALDLFLKRMHKGEQKRFSFSSALLTIGFMWDAPPHTDVVMDVELLHCPQREDLFRDGGVIKLELSRGPGQLEPRPSSEVQVSYKVAADGEVVGASRHSVYNMGQGALGRLSEVLDRALLTMHRGDEAVLVCKPQYAFGGSVTNGRYANRPAKVTLILEEIFEVLDVSLAGSGALLKKRIREGVGKDTVHDSAKVSVRVKSVTANGDVPEGLVLPQLVEFTAGNGEVSDALEASVLHMHMGEEALIRCSQPEDARGGLPWLPEALQAPVLIRVEMINFEKVDDRWDMQARQRIEHCRRRKEVASDLYKRNRWKLAAHHYGLISTFFEAVHSFKDAEDEKEGCVLRRLAWLNKAMCMLKLKNWGAAVELCNSVLLEEPENLKALFRRATAMSELRDYAGAEVDLCKLIDLEPTSVEGKRLLVEVRKLKKVVDKKQSPLFSRMCNALGEMPERETSNNHLVTMPDFLRTGYKLPPAPEVAFPEILDSNGTGMAPVPQEVEDAGTGEAPCEDYEGPEDGASAAASG